MLKPNVDRTEAALQCARNCQAILDFYNVKGVDELIHSQSDRCYFKLNKGYIYLSDILRANYKYFKACNYKNHGKWATSGIREDKSGLASQWIIHRFEGDVYLEIDFDYWNPVDVVGFIGHLFEVAKNKITGSTTDPFRVAKILRKRNILVDKD